MTGDERPRVAVVGAGPAGLMAAEIAAASGSQVTVFDQRRAPGRKFLLAGRSGLNLTNDEPHEQLCARFTPCPPPLRAALDDFGTEAVRAWAKGLGVTTFVGSTGRVFPEEMGAAPLLRAWLGRLDELGVERRGEHRFAGWGARGRLRFVSPSGAAIDSDETFDAVILAVGGASWPKVSSDGAWVGTLAAAGIDIDPLRAANCGVHIPWSEPFRSRFEGHPVKNVRVQCGEVSARGDLMVTSTGLEGGPIYTAVAGLGPADEPGRVMLDLAPDLDRPRLLERLARRRKKDSQSTWLRRVGLEPIAVGLLREGTGNRLPDDADAMADLIGSVVLSPATRAPIDRAISTAGGVKLAGLDNNLMLRSRPGTFFAGEMLDWDAPTGGYLLHGCLATGRRAGAAAVDWLAAQPR